MAGLELDTGVGFQGARLSALSGMADSVLIIVTFIALVDLMGLEWLPLYGWVMLMAVVLFHFFSGEGGSYRSWRSSDASGEARAVLLNWSLVVTSIVLTGFILGPTDVYNRELLLAWFVFTPLELISWHSIVRMVLNWFHRSSPSSKRRVAILGATDLGSSLANRLQGRPDLEFVGFYDDRADQDGRRAASISVNGGVEKLISDARHDNVDIIYITLPMKAESRMQLLCEELSDSTVSVYLMLDLFCFDLLNARWKDIDGLPAVSIYESPHLGVDGFGKRAFDIVTGGLALVVLSIPMLLIATAVKCSSPGPVLFVQKRYGAGGKPIGVFKFRSMKVMDAGDGDVQQATKNDSRITPLGAILRKTSLDELPQLFNVVAGSMSLVGPRPHAVSHNEQYRGQIYGYMLRHKVKPGITGLAQINGYRGETDTLDKMEGRIRYDLEYIRRWSLFLDIKIILMTPIRILNDENAY